MDHGKSYGGKTPGGSGIRSKVVGGFPYSVFPGKGTGYPAVWIEVRRAQPSAAGITVDFH